MPAPIDNPFTVLSLIAAPAVLTNASPMIGLSTSNRLELAIERACTLSAEVGRTLDENDEWNRVRLGQLARVEERSALLVNASTLVHLAVGSYACARPVSRRHRLFPAAEVAALVVGVAGIGSRIITCGVLLSKTRTVFADLVVESALDGGKYKQYVERSRRWRAGGESGLTFAPQAIKIEGIPPRDVSSGVEHLTFNENAVGSRPTRPISLSSSANRRPPAILSAESKCARHFSL